MDRINIERDVEQFVDRIVSKATITSPWPVFPQVERLLSEKQLALWRWAQARREPTVSRRNAAAALGFRLRTVERIVARLPEMKRL